MTGRRVVLCTYSSLYSSLVLQGLLEAKGLQLVGIVNSTRVMRPEHGWLRGALALVRYSGGRYALHLFALTGLFALLQPFSRIETVQRLCRQEGHPDPRYRRYQRRRGDGLDRCAAA